MASVFALSAFLVGCNSGDDTNGEGSDNGTDGASEGTSESGYDENASITYAVDNAPQGMYMPGYTTSATDSQINDFIHVSFFEANPELQFEPRLAEWETEDNQHYTFTIQEGVKWHNGEELTANDWKFAIEVLADPDYTGERYSYVSGIEGAEERKAGDADEVSGFEVIDEYTVEVTFSDARVNNLENLWPDPMPKAELEDIAIADLEDAPELREHPVGLGPFKVANIVAGESLTLERFDDYYDETAKIAEVVVRVVDPSISIGALQNGEVDFMEVRPDDVPDLESQDHLEVIDHPGLGYSYIGFRFGHRDEEASENNADFDKFEDVRLRQAMFYALDRESLINAYLGGYATPVNTPVPTSHWIAAPESELTQYNYDVEKAEELLDEAGYVDTDGDGFREDPDGEEFTISFGHYEGPAAFEGRTQAIMQAWNDIGLRTELATGGLVEFNTFNEMKRNDDEALETFFGAWVTGTDPDPSNLWGSNAEWNYGRWVNEESDELLADALSEASFDEDYRRDVYIEWQQLFNEELPGLPVWENVDLYAKNTRVEGVTIDVRGGVNNPNEWYVAQ